MLRGPPSRRRGVTWTLKNDNLSRIRPGIKSWKMTGPWIGLELDTPERENAWVKDFIGRLSDVLRNVSKP